MNLIFTKHALYRIRERGFIEIEVIEAIKYPDIIIKKEDKYFFRKKNRRGTIEVICERTERDIKIITVCWY